MSIQQNGLAQDDKVIWCSSFSSAGNHCRLVCTYLSTMVGPEQINWHSCTSIHELRKGDTIGAACG